jgi:hypothetical protein
MDPEDAAIAFGAVCIGFCLILCALDFFLA